MKKKNFSNKAQATIFMIVGLLIVLGGALFIYSTQKEKEQLVPQVRISEEKVPIEFDPIRKYANDCAYSAAVEGLQIIGEQGGYISFNERSLNSQPLAITGNPTESEAVTFARGSELKIPYWWYLKSSNDCKSNCEFASKKPELRSAGAQADNSIERQLERYIDLKFRECLNGFEAFAEQGYKITEKGNAKSDVIISSSDVAVIVQYPMTVEIEDRKTDVSQFAAQVPVNLERMYQLAAKITSLQAEHRYIEKGILNLLVSFSGVDRQKLPPMSDMTFDFGNKLSWQKSDVKQKVTGLLESYIPLFQVDSAANFERSIFDSELKQRLYDQFIIPVSNSSFSSLAVSFSYLDFWPAYFDLNCKGEICRPASITSIIPIIGLQSYKFAYDLSYPVLVEIRDPVALNGKGYNFNVFLEGNIRNNRYMNTEFKPLEFQEAEKTQLCDSKTSGKIAVKVIDAAEKKPIENAQVLYTVTGESCFIGPTEGDGALNERFPVGIGGVVNIVADGYIGKGVEFDPQIGIDSALKVELQPIYTKEIVVKKKNYAKTLNGWEFVNEPESLSDKETATVSLARIGDENELEFSAFADYYGGQKEKSEMEIAPGNYEANINLLLNKRIVIPEQTRHYWVLFVKKSYTVPAVDFGENAKPGQEQFPSGGLKLNITISPDDLKNHGKIVLYAVNVDIAGIPEQQRVIEDLEQMGQIEKLSGLYQVALQPSFE
ncbi:hypothetical protein HYS31_04820 [Candidatus Woesearchaeota archaeon]|nr:hypothetical protein [Candidatus Woesearchaeota archaeon]